MLTVFAEVVTARLLQALTSTVDGDVVVWELEALPAAAPQGPQGPAPASGRRALKIIRLHGASIQHLSSIGGFVVTGGADGLVRMFDSGMRLCAWFEDMDAGPITCVSFATKGQKHPEAAMHMSRWVAGLAVEGGDRSAGADCLQTQIRPPLS